LIILLSSSPFRVNVLDSKSEPRDIKIIQRHRIESKLVRSMYLTVLSIPRCNYFEMKLFPASVRRSSRPPREPSESLTRPGIANIPAYEDSAAVIRGVLFPAIMRLHACRSASTRGSVSPRRECARPHAPASRECA